MVSRNGFGGVHQSLLVIFFLCVPFCFRVVYGGEKKSKILLQSEYALEHIPLTTEKIWELDPHQSNPHRQRWLLVRNTKIPDLSVKILSAGKKKTFGVEAQHVLTVIRGYVRSSGPWYQDILKFGCEHEPNTTFATEEGTRRTATLGADEWAEMLKKNLPSLFILLNRIQKKSEQSALMTGQEVFRQWLSRLDNQWYVKLSHLIRKQEWETYRDEATALGVCEESQERAVQKKPLFWESMLEEVPTAPVPISALLARAPIRLWNGLPSVRVSILVGDHVLNGRFLIDSATHQSVMSPHWMEVQGVYPVWAEVPQAPLGIVFWSDLWSAHRKLGRIAKVDRVEVGGLKIPLRELVLLNTDFFAPPSSVGRCCDGVLGSDFLKLFPIEFNLQGSPELNIWSKSGFHENTESTWIEVSENPWGALVSDCRISQQSAHHSIDLGVRWNTGSQKIIVSSADDDGSHKKEKVSLRCADKILGVDLDKDFDSHRPRENHFLPAVDVGMGFLQGLRHFTFDVPHGRLWLGHALPLHIQRENNSGLSVRYRLIDGDRILKVVQLQNQSPADTLVKAGLRVGDSILQVDGVNADELDEWQLMQKLAGDAGPQIRLQWKGKTGLNSAQLRVGLLTEDRKPAARLGNKNPL